MGGGDLFAKFFCLVEMCEMVILFFCKNYLRPVYFKKEIVGKTKIFLFSLIVFQNGFLE